MMMLVRFFHGEWRTASDDCHLACSGDTHWGIRVSALLRGQSTAWNFLFDLFEGFFDLDYSSETEHGKILPSSVFGLILSTEGVKA